MSCFPCFSSKKSKPNNLPVAHGKEVSAAFLPSSTPVHNRQIPSNEVKNQENDVLEGRNIAAQTYTFRELAAATKNFRQECLLGDGRFGRVYKGTLQPSGKIVAVKQLDRNGMQGNKEFLVEVLMLSLLKHQNLLSLFGYCADGDQRLLVFEYMPLGSLEIHLFEKKSLDWETRMRIASGIAQGLEYLHEKANPPVIYRDLKSSNILLDEEYSPRLSDFGLAKLVQSGNKSSVPARVMGTYGYCGPEYTRDGQLTLKSDIYSFGVVLLELITGRRAMDPSQPTAEQNLVTWAQPFFRDPKRFPEMADPLLKGEFSVKSLNQAVGVAAMCLEDEPAVRPFIADVVAALGPSSNLSAPNPMDDHYDEQGDSSDTRSEDSSYNNTEDSSSDNEGGDSHNEKYTSAREH